MRPCAGAAWHSLVFAAFGKDLTSDLLTLGDPGLYGPLARAEPPLRAGFGTVGTAFP